MVQPAICLLIRNLLFIGPRAVARRGKATSLKRVTDSRAFDNIGETHELPRAKHAYDQCD